MLISKKNRRQVYKVLFNGAWTVRRTAILPPGGRMCTPRQAVGRCCSLALPLDSTPGSCAPGNPVARRQLLELTHYQGAWDVGMMPVVLGSHTPLTKGSSR